MKAERCRGLRLSFKVKPVVFVKVVKVDVEDVKLVVAGIRPTSLMCVCTVAPPLLWNRLRNPETPPALPLFRPLLPRQKELRVNELLKIITALAHSPLKATERSSPTGKKLTLLCPF